MPFKSLPGYFHAYPTHESIKTPIDSSKEDHLKLTNNFKSWQQLYNSIPNDTPTTSYKLVILARHGQGYHNAAIDRYGMARWDEYWSFLNGDEFGEWLDSKLTPLGVRQVQTIGEEVLLPIFKDLGILPHVFFSSPMRRCLETFIESWTCIFNEVAHNHQDGGDGGRNVKEKVKIHILENIRETLGEHTCDKRVTHSIAVDEYQNYELKSGHVIKWKYGQDYPEEDTLWLPDHRETKEEMDIRIHGGLTELFSRLTDEQRFVSITCHSGVIGSALRNLKHPPILNLDTGKIVATVVEIKKSNLNAYERVN
ncbi:putative phosphomutase NDAI_0E02060 [Naumovozyma dairenensis CBS 421]|uniref:Phosphoglycerate mutase n=1 Tax=Naumovozyma dairenensis (strain ATCC 10597 / BCRC 20456 / CBS 421 / NBRC 0211 / NRRL Y-12639) TaxID=1071378 RepID=G0WBA2_NAUDC|nr:hypothetical protein NDAI_0E02060 [Naumovozyma dairenensis CBS 421]CCD25022.1 hypothetical protein NDAI_0E02060 [Naumovozyma dairenensis CBS 421]